MKKRLKGILLTTMLFGLVAGCSTNDDANGEVTDESGAEVALEAGTYTISKKGHNAPMEIDVGLTESEIETIEIVSHNESEGIADVALIDTPKEIIEHQSVSVDAKSGATVTSAAIMSAVRDAIEEAGGDVDNFRKEIEKKDDFVEQDADVVIIGGGGAGMAAALSAAENGASVIVIEKNAYPGGNTILAGGGYNSVDPERQSKQEMTDKQYQTVQEIAAVEPKNELHAELLETLKEQMSEYEASGSNELFDTIEFHALQTYAGGDYVGNLEMIIEFAEGAASTTDYLEEIGFPWKPTVRTYMGALWPRSHESSVYKSGHGFIDVYEKRIEENNYPVEYLLSTTATDLITEDDVIAGVKAGVKATAQDGTEYELTANQGVIIATGGFAGSPEMRKKYNPDLLESLPTTNTPANTGDGIVMAESVGANLIGMEHIQSLPVTDPVDGRTGNDIGPSSGMMINKEGKRFVNEDERRDNLVAAILEQTDGIYYSITNEENAMLDENNENKNGLHIDDLLADKKTFKADTLAELAEIIDVDPEVFEAEVKEFQAAYDAGYDEKFDRVNFDEYVDLSAGGPYYASPRSPAVHHTMGGIEINQNCEVLNQDGDLIQNLYAAGEVTGGIHGANRLGANAIPDVLYFGRVAGEMAATSN